MTAKPKTALIERFEDDYPIKTPALDVYERRPLGVGAGSQGLRKR
ncbi:hypothetical protein [Pseudaminobacter soli (ex Li et al. 2025)]|nr:hypothetical protein [Mesorhizobium soli]